MKPNNPLIRSLDLPFSSNESFQIIQFIQIWFVPIVPITVSDKLC